ncbi:hypothetical protein F2981_32825 (plasmid) [Sinorhizobium meliloti]|nr:hypothetical protein [Sinorhizobium meliloti]
MSWAPGERSALRFRMCGHAMTAQQNRYRLNPPDRTGFHDPRLELPKGGGAIRGIGESFRVNAINGTPTLSFPLPSTRARGFDAGLSLTYDSGLGADIFGWGGRSIYPQSAIRPIAVCRTTWTATAATRATFSSLPAKTLCAALLPRARLWSTKRDGYVIRRYAPRIERQFPASSAGHTRRRESSTGSSRRRAMSQRVRSGTPPRGSLDGRGNTLPAPRSPGLLRERLDDRGNRLRID